MKLYYYTISNLILIDMYFLKVFEIVDFGNSEKSNKNKLAALVKKNKVDGGIGGFRRVFYSLVVFECK